ncbi:ribosomal RNA large subunit methyltransferase J [Oesophagostomum dentatum]|uniref:Ribosomal RNA large subunit methyltransferase J n=1 Tax=Oesophagostomum dentatum TaxID=61180 RepID=A0A0B1T4S6_OESDE|nr:ribosomal RNA large subunit methyltransferase J [Oesophagostomum dentatum]
MSPIDGVIQLQGDITRADTAKKVIEIFGTQADLVVCDGAPDVTGIHSLDEYVQAQLVLAALNISTFILRPGGTFVAKIFRARDVSLLYAQLKVFFKEVYCAKPRSSRCSSCEAFAVCRQYSPPEGFVPNLEKRMGLPRYSEKIPKYGPNQVTVPFVACGDLCGFDSDGFYPLRGPDVPVGPLGKEYVFHEVVQPPTEPAYKKAVELKKEDRLTKPNYELKKIVKKFERVKTYTSDKNAGNLGYEDDMVESITDFLMINDEP